MDEKAFDEAPNLAARLMAVEAALLLVMLRLDDDVKSRLKQSLQRLQNDAASPGESPLARAQADVYRKMRMVLDGDIDEYFEQLLRSLE